MSRKSSELQIGALLAGLFFGGVISAAATLFVFALFPDADWTNTLSVVGVLTLAGCAMGGMLGAVLSDEIARMRSQKFGCPHYPIPIAVRRGRATDRRARHSNALGLTRRVTDPAPPRLRLIHDRKRLAFPARHTNRRGARRADAHFLRVVARPDH